MASELTYWDSVSFLGYLNNEPDKIADCESVLIDAEKGHVLIVTSALTLAEVIFVKGQPRLDPAKRLQVENFFKAEYITVRNVTRIIGHLARDLCWDHGIDPKDAIHVATACTFQIPVIHTFDEGLLKKNGININGYALRIERPHRPQQGDLNLPEPTSDETE